MHNIFKSKLYPKCFLPTLEFDIEVNLPTWDLLASYFIMKNALCGAAVKLVISEDKWRISNTSLAMLRYHFILCKYIMYFRYFKHKGLHILVYVNGFFC